MPAPFDKQKLEVPCPECGRKLKTTMGDARRSRTLRCPGGHSVRMDGSQLDRDMRNLDKTLRKFL